MGSVKGLSPVTRTIFEHSLNCVQEKKMDIWLSQTNPNLIKLFVGFKKTLLN